MNSFIIDACNIEKYLFTDTQKDLFEDSQIQFVRFAHGSHSVFCLVILTSHFKFLVHPTVVNIIWHLLTRNYKTAQYINYILFQQGPSLLIFYSSWKRKKPLYQKLLLLFQIVSQQVSATFKRA